MPCKFATNRFSALAECYYIYEFIMASKMITATLVFMKGHLDQAHNQNQHSSCSSTPASVPYAIVPCILTDFQQNWILQFTTVLINMFLHLEFKMLLSIKKYKLTGFFFFVPRNLLLCSPVHCHRLCITVVTDSRYQFLSGMVLKKDVLQSFQTES